MSRDILWALRWLRKSPLFATAVIVILALGIGANTAVFSIVDAVLLRPLPYASADRLVRVEEGSNMQGLSGVSAQDYRRWRDHPDLFATTAPYVRDIVTLTGSGDPDRVIGVRSSGLFPMLGVHARLGRTL